MRKADFGTGNQETRHESVGWMSSDWMSSEYSAGIPIKKRRFPLYRSPSPPEEEIPIPTQNDSEQKGLCSPSQGSATDVSLLPNSNASSLSACSSSASSAGADSSIVCGAAISSVINNAANIDTSGVVPSTTIAGTQAAASASFPDAITNAEFFQGDLNASIAETVSNANVIISGSSARITVEEGSNSGSLVGSIGETVAMISNSVGSEGNNSVVSGHGDKSIGVTKTKQEPSFALHSGSLAEMHREKKSESSRGSALHMVSGAKTEFNLRTAESCSSKKQKQIFGQEKLGGHCNLRAESAAYRKTELCLGFSHQSSTTTVNQTSEASSNDKENSGSVALSLSSSKNHVPVLVRSSSGNSVMQGSSMTPNRSTWDLNRTVDAWEGINHNDGVDQKNTLVSGLNYNKSVSASPLHSAQVNSAGLPSQSLILGERETNRSCSSAMASNSSELYADYSLRLGLVSSDVQLNLGKEPLSLPGQVDTSWNFTNTSGSSVNADASRTVKSELDYNLKQCSRSSAVYQELDIARVKQEVVDKGNSEDPKSIEFSDLKSAALRSIKLEPAQDDHVEENCNIKRSSTKLDELKPSPPNEKGSSRRGHVNEMPPSDFLKEGVVCSLALPVAVSQNLTVAEHASENLAASLPSPQTLSNISGSKNDCTDESKAVGSNIQEGNESSEVVPAAPQAVGGSVCDDEKINLSEETSFASDYESDGTPNLVMHMDTVGAGAEEDMIDVRKVREPAASLDLEVHMHESVEIKRGSSADAGRVVKHFEAAGENCPPLPSGEEDLKIEDCAEMNNGKPETAVNISSDKSSASDVMEDSRLLGELEVQTPVNDYERKKLVEFTCDGTLYLPGKKDGLTEQDMEQTSNEVSSTSQQTSVTVVQGTGVSGKRFDNEDKNEFVLSKSETFILDKNAGNDVNYGGTRSRIINLSRPSNLSSSGKTRPIYGSLLSARAVRERLPDAPLEENKVQHRGRDELYGDNSRKFSREKHQSYSSRSSKLPYPRGKARFFSRMGPLQGGRDSRRNFDSEFCDGPAYSVARHRYTSSLADEEPVVNNSDEHNGSFFGTGRGGRKFFHDGSSSFPRFSSRRRSPGDSDGHNTRRALPLVRRIPGNISPPSGCTDEERTEFAGLRHGRGFQDCHSGPAFTQTQSYEELDGSFGRRNRNFQTLQRRDINRIRSKSPIRARTRSPGPWSPLGRRTPQDAFRGSSELHSTTQIFRAQRIRSPKRPCFPQELVIQRQDSPPFVSRTVNDLRDMDCARDHGHLRTEIHDRNPSGQVLFRNSRRLDLMDPREQTDCNNYYRRPRNSTDFHDLGSDDSIDSRRYAERQGRGRQFRNTYSSATRGEDFLLGMEDDSRMYRFCLQNESEFPESSNLRTREFDRQVNHRLGDEPPRRRGIGEQEESYRHGGACQEWQEDRFDGMSRMKRKRF